MLDLSALERKEPNSESGDGKPLYIPLQDIEEDPNQPRKEFSEKSLNELAESIKERGVKSPISLRKTHEGKYLINHGARRYRASIIAGLNKIPAFIDEEHDSYDQVIENLHRDDLTPMELAVFIRSRLEKHGESKGFVAKNLFKKDGSVITHHLALLDLPQYIEDIYRSGQCTSAKILYDLKSLNDQYSDEVEQWCSQTPDVTRSSVSALAGQLKKGKKITKDSNNDGNGGEGNSQPGEQTGTQESLGGNENTNSAGSGLEPGDSETNNQNQNTNSSGESNDQYELTSWPKRHAVSDPKAMSKPLMLVEHDGRLAAVILNRRPTEDGLIHIRYDDNGGDAEVKADLCTIKRITDSN